MYGANENDGNVCNVPSSTAGIALFLCNPVN